MRAQLQTAGRRLAPRWAAARARRYEMACREAAGLPLLAGRVIDRNGDRVIDGPCAGLRYPADRLREVDVPVAKLVGSYERQLHGSLAAAIDAGRTPFVDIGCAEGYYAVGLALRRADLEVHAYDHAKSARSFCADLAALNGCGDRVHVHRHCDARQLRALTLDRALVLADVEGAEFELFSEEVVALLARAAVIVELHRPVEDPAVTGLIERFAPSHTAERVDAAPPQPELIGALSFLTPSERAAATNEWRAAPDQTWLVLDPRHA